MSNTIEDNPEDLESTSEAVLAQNIKDNNLEVNMEVEMSVVTNDEYGIGAVEEEAVCPLNRSYNIR